MPSATSCSLLSPARLCFALTNRKQEEANVVLTSRQCRTRRPADSCDLTRRQ